MIAINNKIHNLLNNITATYLMKGLQPSDLADAVFDEAYSSIELIRNVGSIQAIVSFDEVDEGESSQIKMRYTYNRERQLINIAQKINKSSYKVQWDRGQVLEDLVAELRRDLSILNDKNTVESILNTLPDEIYAFIRPKLKLVA